MSKPREELLFPKSGLETFELDGDHLQIKMLDFWRWSYSNILYGTIRGDLAEYIVGTAILDSKSKPNYKIRKDGDLVDFWLDENFKIEVKSSSYLQAWEQKNLSQIKFDIRPRQGYDFENHTPITEKNRHAHIYVFCVLSHTDIKTVNPLAIDQWRFWVLRTQAINEWSKSHTTITLDKLISLKAIESTYEELRTNVDLEFSRIS